MIVLGIDPGKTGAYAILDDGGNFETGTINTHMHNEVVKLADKHSYTAVIVEDVFLHRAKRNIKVTLDHAKSIGAMQAHMWSACHPCFLIPPSVWQCYMFGGAAKRKGKSTEQLSIAYAADNGIITKNHNIADAVCLALYGKDLIALGMAN